MNYIYASCDIHGRTQFDLHTSCLSGDDIFACRKCVVDSSQVIASGSSIPQFIFMLNPETMESTWVPVGKIKFVIGAGE